MISVRIFPRRYRFLKFKNMFILLFMIAILVQILIFSDLNYYKKLTTPTPPIAIHKPIINKLQMLRAGKKKNDSTVLKIPSESEFRINWVKNKLEKLVKYSERWDIMKLLNNVTPLVEPSRRVHIFYYASYGNPENDGEWKMWNQEYIPNKKSEYNRLYYRRVHSPPADIGSNYYPMLGCYSSRDSQVINTHLKQIRDAGIGVVVVSWYPQESQNSTEDTFAVLLDTARKYQLKIAPHIESYTGRNLENLLKNIHFITIKYTSHPAFYKIMKNGKLLPVYYMFESYQLPTTVWRELITSVQSTPNDGVFIGLLLHLHHRYEIEKSHFDGFYTYFSSNGFSYGSSWKNWQTLETFAKKHKLLFFPSISPGYIDTNIRPWNTALTRHRSHGYYYQVAWRSAIAAKPFGVSITSFNNWQEGSQIEPATSKVKFQFTYLNYEPEGPFFYLNLTRYWIKQFILQNNH